MLGAENGARTRDLNLGKVALYQLSYFRLNCFGLQIYAIEIEIPNIFSKNVIYLLRGGLKSLHRSV